MSSKAFTSAIFLGAEGKLSVLQIEKDDKYKPQGTQSLVQVKYSAINPADVKHSYIGLHDYIAGYEWTGTVLERCDDSPFSLGQQLFGMTMPAPKRPLYSGAHQDYLIAEE